ncbi:MAG: hypothetical protein QOJ15_7000 [Bradyrhizobium sp.]|nr:hypothetical protein [Bradyrhizobium sp.]
MSGTLVYFMEGIVVLTKINGGQPRTVSVTVKGADQLNAASGFLHPEQVRGVAAQDCHLLFI